MLEEVFKVKLDDTEFDKLQKHYQDFDKQMAKLPDHWKAAMQQAKAMQVVQAQMMGAQTKQLKNANAQLNVMQRAWKGIYKTVGKVSDSIKGAAGLLGRLIPSLGFLAGGAAALVGLPALMFAGIKSLITGFSGERYKNAIAGTTQGQRTAFTNVWSNYGWSEEDVSRIHGIQLDPTKRGMLYSALAPTFGNERAQNLMNDSDPIRLTKAVMEAIRNQPNQMTANFMGGIVGKSPQEVDALRRMSEEEFMQREKLVDIRSKELDASDANLRKADEFTSQWDEMIRRIKTDIFGKLGDIMPVLTKFADSIGKVADTFIQNGGLDNSLKLFQQGVQSFTSWLNSGDAQRDVKGFIHNVNLMAGAALKVAKFFGLISDEKTIKKDIATSEKYRADTQSQINDFDKYKRGEGSFAWRRQYEIMYLNPEGGVGVSRDDLVAQLKEQDEHIASLKGQLVDYDPAPENTPAAPPTTAVASGKLNAAERIMGAGFQGVDTISASDHAMAVKLVSEKLKGKGYSNNQIAGILGNLEQESGMNPLIVNKKSGAFGIMQWLSKDRVAALQSFEQGYFNQRKDLDPKSVAGQIAAQVAFMIYESENMYKKQYEQLRKKTSLEDSTDYFARSIEAPGADERNDARRLGNARKFLGQGDSGNYNTPRPNFRFTIENRTGQDVYTNASVAATTSNWGIA